MGILQYSDDTQYLKTLLHLMVPSRMPRYAKYQTKVEIAKYTTNEIEMRENASHP